MSDPAIPAATLILVRDRIDADPELLMVQRSPGMAFAGGALVFPGGRVDAADRALAGEEAASGVAAVRETLEETAIPAGLRPTPGPDAALRMQQGLAENGRFGELLAEFGCALDLADLIPFARWVPKFHAVRRFDTMFFIASAPEGDWQPHPIAGECESAFWISAAEVLERNRLGTAQLIFPTRRTLERLAQHNSLADMLEDARAHPIEPVTPWVEEHGGEKFVTIPDHLGYPVTRERLEGLWRG